MKKIQLAGCLFLLSGVLFAGGCRTQDVTAADVRANLVPVMQSLALTHEQRLNVHARTFNTNLRQIPDDLDLIFLLDRPVWLSPFPVP